MTTQTPARAAIEMLTRRVGALPSNDPDAVIFMWLFMKLVSEEQAELLANHPQMFERMSSKELDALIAKWDVSYPDTPAYLPVGKPQ